MSFVLNLLLGFAFHLVLLLDTLPFWIGGVPAPHLNSLILSYWSQLHFRWGIWYFRLRHLTDRHGIHCAIVGRSFWQSILAASKLQLSWCYRISSSCNLCVTWNSKDFVRWGSWFGTLIEPFGRLIALHVGKFWLTLLHKFSILYNSRRLWLFHLLLNLR